MSIYAVIDTNVIVSAFLTKNSDSPTVVILKSLINGDIIPLYNREILNEYREVLNRKKFHLHSDTISAFIQIITQLGSSVNASPVDEILPDADDLVFYEVVMEMRYNDAYLVTGNIKHFPNRDFIVTPSEMVKLIKENNR